MQRAAADVLKDLTASEKKQIGSEERRKHAKSKAKKLEKSLKDVRLHSHFSNITLIAFSVR